MISTDAAVQSNFRLSDVNPERRVSSSRQRCDSFPCTIMNCGLTHDDDQWAVNITIYDLLTAVRYWSTKHDTTGQNDKTNNALASSNYPNAKSKRGTGFGGDQRDSRKSQDKFHAIEIELDKKLSFIFRCMAMVLKDSYEISSVCERIKDCSELSTVVSALWKNDSLMDIASRTILYQSLSELMSAMVAEPLLLPCIFSTHPHCGSGSTIASLISALNDQVTIFLSFHQRTDEQQEQLGTEVEEALLIALHIQQLHLSIQNAKSFADEMMMMMHGRNSCSGDSENEHKKARKLGEDDEISVATTGCSSSGSGNSSSSLKHCSSTTTFSSPAPPSSSSPSCEESWKVEEAKEYGETLQPMRFEAISLCDMITAGTASHAILNSKSKKSNHSSGPTSNYYGSSSDANSMYLSNSAGHAGVVGNPRSRLTRIASEMSSLAASLPVEHSASIFLRCDEARMDVLKALVIGPEGTPYANGCFEFDILLSPDYPNSPPSVLLVTTGGGTMRFNPNLYNCGKVCLSLLGTWAGPGWDPKTSTLLQVLISIQSLIMVPDPFYNEPAYYNSTNQAQSESYNMNIRRGTLQFAILGQMQKPSPVFTDVINEHFRIKRRSLARQLVDWSAMSAAAAAAAAPPSSRGGGYCRVMSSSSHSKQHSQTTDILKNIRCIANLEGVEADYTPKAQPNLIPTKPGTQPGTHGGLMNSTDTLLSSLPDDASDPWASYLPSYLKNADTAMASQFGKSKNYSPKYTGGMNPTPGVVATAAKKASACSYCSVPSGGTSSITCRKCETRRYCSRNCQHADWLYNKKHCPGPGPGPGKEGKSGSAPAALPSLDPPVPVPPTLLVNSGGLPPPPPSPPLLPILPTEDDEDEDQYVSYSLDNDYSDWQNDNDDDDDDDGDYDLPVFGVGAASAVIGGSHSDVLNMDGAEMQAVLQDAATTTTTDHHAMMVDMDDAELQAAFQHNMMYGGGDAEEELQAALSLSLATSSSSSSSSFANEGPLIPWECTICTFVNDGGTQGSCSMCDSIRE